MMLAAANSPKENNQRIVTVITENRRIRRTALYPVVPFYHEAAPMEQVYYVQHRTPNGRQQRTTWGMETKPRRFAAADKWRRTAPTAALRNAVVGLAPPRLPETAAVPS